MNSSRICFLTGWTTGLGLVLALLFPGCGDTATGPDFAPPVGATIWTLPVLASGSEAVTIGDRTVQVGTARGWETESVRVDLMGTQSLLGYRLAEFEHADWLTYMGFLKDKEFVVRIADLDLMILQGGPQIKTEGLLLIGPRQSAEPRARELMKRLASDSRAESNEETAASD